MLALSGRDPKNVNLSPSGRVFPECPRGLPGRVLREVTAGRVADHVIPHKANVNAFWLGELQSLCVRRYSSVKAEIERRGYSTAIGVDQLTHQSAASDLCIYLRPMVRQSTKPAIMSSRLPAASTSNWTRSIGN